MAYLRKLVGGDQFIALAAIEDAAAMVGRAAYERPELRAGAECSACSIPYSQGWNLSPLSETSLEAAGRPPWFTHTS
jgi:hypothetical protein